MRRCGPRERRRASACTEWPAPPGQPVGSNHKLACAGLPTSSWTIARSASIEPMPSLPLTKRQPIASAVFSAVSLIASGAFSRSSTCAAPTIRRISSQPQKPHASWSISAVAALSDLSGVVAPTYVTHAAWIMACTSGEGPSDAANTKLATNEPTSNAAGPKKANSASITFAGPVPPSAGTITEPVCRSPCTRHCFVIRKVDRMASTPSQRAASARRAAATSVRPLEQRFVPSAASSGFEKT
mmetsp:Transcript_10028/g.32180  ORF Transcript_10028/g.32180 Transcript_10028/m.32180 type:complete len:242 (-) Transcript_10028:466-1191(-)